jgi:hypothetical protein
MGSRLKEESCSILNREYITFDNLETSTKYLNTLRLKKWKPKNGDDASGTGNYCYIDADKSNNLSDPLIDQYGCDNNLFKSPFIRRVFQDNNLDTAYKHPHNKCVFEIEEESINDRTINSFWSNIEGKECTMVTSDINASNVLLRSEIKDTNERMYTVEQQILQLNSRYSFVESENTTLTNYVGQNTTVRNTKSNLLVQRNIEKALLTTELDRLNSQCEIMNQDLTLKNNACANTRMLLTSNINKQLDTSTFLKAEIDTNMRLRNSSNAILDLRVQQNNELIASNKFYEKSNLQLDQDTVQCFAKSNENMVTLTKLNDYIARIQASNVVLRRANATCSNSNAKCQAALTSCSNFRAVKIPVHDDMFELYTLRNKYINWSNTHVACTDFMPGIMKQADAAQADKELAQSTLNELEKAAAAQLLSCADNKTTLPNFIVPDPPEPAPARGGAPTLAPFFGRPIFKMTIYEDAGFGGASRDLTFKDFQDRPSGNWGGRSQPPYRFGWAEFPSQVLYYTGGGRKIGKGYPSSIKMWSKFGVFRAYFAGRGQMLQIQTTRGTNNYGDDYYAEMPDTGVDIDGYIQVEFVGYDSAADPLILGQLAAKR